MGVSSYFLKVENEKIVPALNKALNQVKTYKETMMEEHKCEFCGKVLATARGLKIHKSTVHKGETSSKATKAAAPPPAQPSVATPAVQSVTQAKPGVPPLAQPHMPGPQPSVEVTPPVEQVQVPAPQPEAIPEVEPPISAPTPPTAPEKAASTPPPAPPISVPVVAPPPPAKTPLLSVPVGAMIMLNGPTWWQDPSGEWKAQNADKLPVQVVSKEITNDETSLLCQAQGGTAMWAVKELQVLNGEIKLLKLPPVTTSPTTGDFKPPAGIREVEKPEFNCFEGEDGCEKDTKESSAALIAQEKAKAREADRIKYEKGIKKYVEAKVLVAATKKKFDKVNKDERPFLWHYVEEYGTAPKEGDKGSVVNEFGVKAQIICQVGGVTTDRNTDKIIDWCLDNEAEDCLDYRLDPVKWDRLKETGVVPAEFIREVEKPVPVDDKFSFRVDKI